MVAAVAVVLLCALLCPVTPCYTLLRSVVPCYVLLCPAVPCCALLHPVTPCNALLRHELLQLLFLVIVPLSLLPLLLPLFIASPTGTIRHRLPRAWVCPMFLPKWKFSSPPEVSPQKGVFPRHCRTKCLLLGELLELLGLCKS